MSTIRKNSKEYKRAFARMKVLRVYSLDNNFHGDFAAGIDDWCKDIGKLTKHLDHYRLSVHSNLWYEWGAA